ncbi:MAG: hypothetical protein WBV28_21765 [Terracidiphilus sp.]
MRQNRTESEFTRGPQPSPNSSPIYGQVQAGCHFESLILVAHAIDPFCSAREPESLRRLQRITLIPYMAALATAFLGGVPNPAGWKVLFTAAVPAAAASFGLTQLDHFSAATAPHPVGEPSAYVQRSVGWIVAALAILILFVAFLGPGIRFR